MTIYENVTVVIPTARENLITTDSVPPEAELVIRRDEGLNVARNAGVRAANNEWIVIADDDIDFPTETVSRTLSEMDERTLAGLADFPPLRWILGRLMVFHVDLWKEVGGFDESRHHGGDTDFAIKVEEHGGRIIRLDRDAVPHYDEDTGLSMSIDGHLEWTYYLLRRHPTRFGPIAARLVGRKLRTFVTD